MDFISIKARLPKEVGTMGFSEKVKVKTQEGHEFVSFYDFWERCWNCNGIVTHWQPLTSLPE
jgi:hypothetical protein